MKNCQIYPFHNEKNPPPPPDPQKTKSFAFCGTLKIRLVGRVLNVVEDDLLCLLDDLGDFPEPEVRPLSDNTGLDNDNIFSCL